MYNHLFPAAYFYPHPQTRYEWMKGVIAMSNSFVFANFTRALQEKRCFPRLYLIVRIFKNEYENRFYI